MRIYAGYMEDTCKLMQTSKMQILFATIKCYVINYKVKFYLRGNIDK